MAPLIWLWGGGTGPTIVWRTLRYHLSETSSCRRPSRNMKEIPLNHNKVALVDDEDYDRINQYHWSAQYTKGSWRAIMSKQINKVQYHYNMARMVMGVTDRSIKVSPINHNQLDCQKANLRLASHIQTCWTQRKSKGPGRSSSQYKGVSYSKRLDRWRAFIGVNKQTLWLGTYHTEAEAAEMYNQAAIEHFGEFACLNEISE